MRPFDFGRIAQYFTLDVISDLAYSEAFGCLKEDRDTYGYIEAVEQNMPFIMLVSTMPKLSWVLRTGILKAFMPSEKDDLGFGRVLRYVMMRAWLLGKTSSLNESGLTFGLQDLQGKGRRAVWS